MASLNGSIWPCEGPDLSVEWIDGWPNASSVIFAAHQPLRSQCSPIIPSLYFIRYFEVFPLAHLPPMSYPFVSTHDVCAAGQIFYLVWKETLLVATSIESGLKDNKWMHLFCEFCTRDNSPWQVIMTYCRTH